MQEMSLAKMIAAARQCGVKISSEAIITYIHKNEMVPESFYDFYKSASTGILKDDKPDCLIAELSVKSAGLTQ